MGQVLRASNEIQHPAEPGLIVEYALAELAMGTRSLLHKTGATDQLVFQPGEPYHASLYPDTDDWPPDFKAEKVGERDWQVDVYASSPYRHPRCTTSLIMSHLSYAIILSNFEPVTVKSMRRDLYVDARASERYRPGSYRNNNNAKTVLRTIVPAVSELRKGYDSNPADWIVK